ncbi:MAG: hypothetical protein LBP96_01905 [Bacteroidales bacterium]|jgi:thioredoxin|nr:hypothetical protein [Bacteroidales bacterium]
MKKIITIAIFISLFLCAFSQTQIRVVSHEEFEELMIITEREQLIDIRTPEEFEKSRIRGARNMDVRNSNFRKEIEELDKKKPVLVYCFVELRSRSSEKYFEDAEFETVYMLGGGLNAWSKAGKPVEIDLSGVGELSIKDYDSLVSKKGYVLVNFFAQWCAPCRKMSPILDELTKTYPDEFKLVTLDFDQNRLLANEKNIKSLPCIIIFKNGEKIWETFDETSREELVKVLDL